MRIKIVNISCFLLLYWIYLPLWALFSIALQFFFVNFQFVLKTHGSNNVGGIWILLVFYLSNDWKVYVCLKRMFKLRQINKRLIRIANFEEV